MRMEKNGPLSKQKTAVGRMKPDDGGFLFVYLPFDQPFACNTTLPKKLVMERKNARTMEISLLNALPPTLTRGSGGFLGLG
ncbi:hypothetical protein ABS784_09000 [Geobacillus sp. G4]|uniref:Uncharacterized protein n=1 Tax=Bacillus caldolyticus TaxID=1394 RepID=A0ABM6QJF2_BACCL|nr:MULTISPECIES: hypothetical protein [Geobacillus]AMV10747.1 hypothetical protein GT3570_07275 [Geobacillus thermoleovorans]AUI35555.1 hypothetical protein CWI35_02625 [[Bacillus] caldolyticus]QDY73171.1 hypothetical protein FP515_08390 [Geobacillus thermoleovorans]TRY43543.1 hypothetical protein FOI67_07560 [Geobacillus sp. LEMMJ02]WMJ21337.1 hypothetical protein RA957_07440 [Geobacillus kaustophilus]